MKIFYVLISSLVTVTMVTGAILASDTTSADSKVDEISVTIETACTMTGTGMNSHNATIPNGTYQDSIGTTTLKAFCNDTNGFAIYANGYTGDTLGNNKLIGSSTSSEIVTGTATTAGSPDVSNWAMKLETNSSATYALTLDNGFGSYSSVPSSYTKVAHRDSGTDLGTSAEGATLTSTYAAYIAKTQPADSYQGQVIYTLVHPASADAPLSPQAATPGCINYFANVSDAVGEMGCQTISTSTTSADLWASNFSRAGYGFAGWSDKYDYATNPNANLYGPNETITFTAGQYTGDNNGLSLYAIWIPSNGTLQNWDGCGSMNIGDVTALTDTRDNETYAVAKLADGKCWMVENLRLENTASNNTEGSLAQGYNPSFIGLASPESYGFSSEIRYNSLYSDNNSTAATISGDNVGYRFPRYNNSNTNNRQPSTNYRTSRATYSYGNYYTWHAAIADTTNYSSGDHSSTSICPKGWHLPTGGYNTKEFGVLNIALGGTGGSQSGTSGTAVSEAFRSYPNNFLYSSGYIDTAMYYRDGYSYYWSSTAYNNSVPYTLTISVSTINPKLTDFKKFYGATIRCLADS